MTQINNDKFGCAPYNICEKCKEVCSKYWGLDILRYGYKHEKSFKSKCYCYDCVEKLIHDDYEKVKND